MMLNQGYKNIKSHIFLSEILFLQNEPLLKYALKFPFLHDCFLHETFCKYKSMPKNDYFCLY